MAHFFEAWGGMTKANAVVAANAPGISSIKISASGNATFGIYGGDGAGNWPEIKVYRGAGVVDAKKVPVNVILEDKAEWNRIVTVGGLLEGDEIYGMTKLGQRYTTVLKVEKVSGKALDEMQEWAKRLKSEPGYKPLHAPLCKHATPYLAYDSSDLTKLDDRLIGGPLSTVHGLAVHTTGGGGARDAMQTAIYGCAQTWNLNRRKKEEDGKGKPFSASAHFAISSKGDIIQLIPTNRVAFAQGDPGDHSWISVEVDNDGVSRMNEIQLIAVRLLFSWVREEYGVPPELSVGTIYEDGKFTDLDALTKKVCDSYGGTTSKNIFLSSMTRGLSCHLWLDPRHGKPCPGKGMLGQMATIIKPELTPI